jgi:hypothetical protein
VFQPGFIVKVKSKGSYYFYLRRSFRDEDKKPKNKSLYSFGNYNKAINNLELWIRNFDLFPNELKAFGYNQKDVIKWISEIKKNTP